MEVKMLSHVNVDEPGGHMNSSSPPPPPPPHMYVGPQVKVAPGGHSSETGGHSVSHSSETGGPQCEPH